MLPESDEPAHLPRLQRTGHRQTARRRPRVRPSPASPSLFEPGSSEFSRASFAKSLPPARASNPAARRFDAAPSLPVWIDVPRAAARRRVAPGATSSPPVQRLIRDLHAGRDPRADLRYRRSTSSGSCLVLCSPYQVATCLRSRYPREKVGHGWWVSMSRTSLERLATPSPGVTIGPDAVAEPPTRAPRSWLELRFGAVPLSQQRRVAIAENLPSTCVPDLVDRFRQLAVVTR